jgi:Pilus assembly protein, PilP
LKSPSDTLRYARHPGNVSPLDHWTAALGSPVKLALPACLLLLALAPPLAAQQCDLSRSPPLSWQRVDTAAMALHLPSEAYAKDLSGDGSSAWRIVADGLEITVDYGRAAPDQLERLELGSVSRLIAGRLAAVTTEEMGDGGRISTSWNDVGQRGNVASLDIVLRDRSRWSEACRIMAGVRLFHDVSTLRLLRVIGSGEHRYVVLAGPDRSERRVSVGEYASTNWGQVTKIEADAVEITEALALPGGGSEKRVTRLKRQR